MDNKTVYLLIEKFEVLSQAAEEAIYILMEKDETDAKIECKVDIRLDRINDEVSAIEEIMNHVFKK